MKEKTLEVFTGEKPEVLNFHVFGCPVYIHVPDEKGTKLESLSILGTAGYSRLQDQHSSINEDCGKQGHEVG